MKKKKNIKVGLFTFLILFTYFIYYSPFPEELHGFCVIPYFLRYQDWGFISRGLLGSLLGMCFPVLSTKMVFCFIAMAILILCFLVAFFLNYIYEKNEWYQSEWYLIVFFVLNPASVAFLFYWGNYGRFDLFLIMILIASCFIIIKKQNLWLLPCLCVLGNVIHQGFLFMYLPAILVLIFYGYLKEKNKSTLCLLVVSVCLSILSFLYMQFFGKINGVPYEEVIRIVSNNTDYELSGEAMIRLEYFTPVLKFIPMYVLPKLPQNVIKVFIIFLMYLPAVKIFFLIWKKAGGAHRWMWVCPLLPICMIVPKFLITVDYGRDFAAVIISEFMILFTLISLQDEVIQGALKEWNLTFNSHKYTWWAYLLIMASVGKFEAANILGFSEKIYQLIIRIL